LGRGTRMAPRHVAESDCLFLWPPLVARSIVDQPPRRDVGDRDSHARCDVNGANSEASKKRQKGGSTSQVMQGPSRAPTRFPASRVPTTSGRIGRKGIESDFRFWPVAEATAAREFYWVGATGTAFWVDPKERLIAIMMVQLPLEQGRHYRSLVRNLVYQALTD
jgi:CubicO group peptidase (beta-lactamase class C family)